MQKGTQLQSPEVVLQKLIQFDTTNPPGNEANCINYIAELLGSVMLDYKLYAKDENRPNLVCRIKGNGEASPILIYGHADVVTTSGQDWTYPPFSGEIAEGYVWGRGALDMKGGLAMMIHAMMRIKMENIKPAGDIIFLVLADEENFGEFGAKFMVSEHPEVFKGVKYALGEFGGFNITLGGKRFYPIQVAEKQACSLKLTISGPGGHGSGIVPGNAMGKLGVILDRLEQNMLPVHITKPVRMMMEKIAEAFGFPISGIVKLVLNPLLTDFLLRQLGDVGLAFLPMFHNTINPTIVRGGDKLNVIPSKIEVNFDGRMLPGFQPEQLLAEVEAVLPDMKGVELEVQSYSPGPTEIDLGLFDHLSNVLKGLDPEGKPVPLLLTAVTDGRFLSRLGIQSYGFLPMKLPEDFAFLNLAHAADERIPVEALGFGAEGIYQALVTYRG